MKPVFRLGLFLAPFLLFLSQNAYSQGHFRNASLRYLRPMPSVPVTIIAHGEASRSPASGSAIQRRSARIGECPGLLNLETGSTIQRPVFAFLHENARAALPIEGSGMGAQAAVFHFGE